MFGFHVYLDSWITLLMGREAIDSTRPDSEMTRDSTCWCLFTTLEKSQSTLVSAEHRGFSPAGTPVSSRRES